ncbi:hypothetical protein HETIRDRAFT_410721 [Heterobasidion irregulare TC 32-1]|uniref:Uncharacterized protein n=1 Tax=Heterobasidion irregulare (strain TC 32-1) TaxID=747525 RepID=W4K0V8_HETIT|nr:uncharacterized protein HETIRDRAFT_410721 [Heterobasidion irregulare TC 32-1]ETW78756.1 hypothetical protein HETIRDRAFT_410721 [Heterobasidion irregulare TC 32-1]
MLEFALELYHVGREGAGKPPGVMMLRVGSTARREARESESGKVRRGATHLRRARG